MKKTIILTLSIIILIILLILIYYKMTFINKTEVKRIVLEDMSIKENEINLYEVDFDRKSKIFIYEVSFIYDNNEYEYILDAKSGKILSNKIDED